MSGNSNQYDPTSMFQDWIQKSGQAQAEFIRGFGSLMAAGGRPGRFNPLETLREVSEATRSAQSSMMENVSAMQSRSMDVLMDMIPSIASWGAYKTAVGSNGRISIPEAERSALGIDEGDLVQVIILPIPNKRKREVNKQ